MKAKFSLVTVAVILLLTLGLLAACSRGRNDAQIAADVQAKINSDAAVQSRQYTVQASNGVVTLSGTVNSDMERAAAANDAGSVAGVRTVVNNLQVGPPQQAAAQPPQQFQAEPPANNRNYARSEPAPSRRKSSGLAPGQRRASSSPSYSNEPPVLKPNREVASNAPSGWSDTGSLPSRPAVPSNVTIPDGTTLSIRLVDPLSSEVNKAGDTFRASLESPVSVGDQVVIPAHADVQGRVVDAKPAAHFSGSSALAIELTRLSVNGKSYELHTNQWAKQGTGRGKNTAAKVGGGAALGAIIGGIAGGGKGAAIGGAIGAGAGTTAQGVTHGQQIKLSSEQVLNFQLESPLNVTPSAGNERPGRQRLEVQ